MVSNSHSRVPLFSFGDKVRLAVIGSTRQDPARTGLIFAAALGDRQRETYDAPKQRYQELEEMIILNILTLLPFPRC